MRVEHAEEFVFAKIAAIRGVRAVLGILHFVGFDEFMANTELGDKILDDRAVMRGITWGKRGDG